MSTINSINQKKNMLRILGSYPIYIELLDNNNVVHGDRTVAQFTITSGNVLALRYAIAFAVEAGTTLRKIVLKNLYNSEIVRQFDINEVFVDNSIYNITAINTQTLDS